MARILCVGIATLDIVNQVERYPVEDSEVRALAQSQRLGGNAANTACVLSQLGHQVSWVGNLAASAPLIEQQFAHFGVDISLASRLPGGVTPTSYITLSQASGSRSIVHYRDLPEYPAAAFQWIDLRPFDWVHFEGRAVDQLTRMLQRVRGMCGLPISLEVEKPRPAIEALFEQADLLLCSRDYALLSGHADAAALLASLAGTIPAATCTWGEAGAWAVDHQQAIFHAPAPRLERVVDTLGAGDVFNAGMVHGLASGVPVAQSLAGAVALAADQCAREGLELPDGRMD